MFWIFFFGYIPRIEIAGSYGRSVFAICSKMGGLGGHYAKRNKSNRENQILCDIAYILSHSWAGQTYLQPLSVCFLHLKAIQVINIFSYKINDSKTCGVEMKSLPTPAPPHHLPLVACPFTDATSETGLGVPSSLFSSMHLLMHNTPTQTTHKHTLHTYHTYYTQHTRYAHHTHTHTCTHPRFVYFINGVHGHPFISSYSMSPCSLEGCPVI